MNSPRPPLAAAVLVLAAMTGATAQAQTATPPRVANATSVEGTAYVTRADGRQSILARGTALGVGDSLSTTRNSTVRLRFTDGGETAIRPDSRITVQAYNYAREEPQSDSLILGLLRGGLRAITGSIGKRGNVDAYKLNVSTATIGIRGTDYTARLCNNDCVPAASGSPVERSARPNSGPPVIARLMQAQGTVTVERDTRQIEVAPGAALYASDRVATAPGGHAVLGFRDDSRITLNSGTRLALAQFNYDAAQPARGNMLLQLLSGGLRVATGLIAKASPRQVQFKTSTATVGIRGTVFDLACGKGDATDNPPEADLSDAECEQSLFASTRSGEIVLAAADGREVAIPAGQAGVVPGGAAPARPLSSTPAFFNNLSTPAPESVELNLEQQFGTAPPTQPEEGSVYLMVREGRVVLEQGGQSLPVDAGESAYAGQSLAPVRLASTPVLLDRDPTLSNRVFNFNICRP